MALPTAIEPHPGYDSAARYWTRILVRLFPLPPIGAFPALSRLPSDDEAEVIDRFIFQAARLTESAGLNRASGVRNSLSRDGEWKVESNFPTYEERTGLAAQFRQLYSTARDERSSFYKVRDILGRLSCDGTEHEKTRREMLGVWSDAVGQLRSKGALRLAEEKIDAARASDPVELRPDMLIRIFLNGEHLHWDADHASELSERTAWPEFEANLRYKYHEAVAPIAYLFILFAHFVNELLGRSVAHSST